MRLLEKIFHKLKNVIPERVTTDTYYYKFAWRLAPLFFVVVGYCTYLESVENFDMLTLYDLK